MERDGHEFVDLFGFAIGGEELEQLVVVDLHYLYTIRMNADMMHKNRI